MKSRVSFFYFIFSTFVSFLTVLSYFYDTLPSQFYFVHDESLCVNFEEASKKFINYDFENFGQGISTYLIITFFDTVYYYLSYLFLDSVRQVQMVLLFFKIQFLLLFSYLGFKGLAESFDQKEEFKVIASAVLYSFSMFTIIYFHGNNFASNQLICYGLSPYIVSIILKILRSNDFNLKDLLKLSISLFICSFSVFLFAVLLVVIFFIFVFYVFIYWSEIEKKILLKNLFFIVILTIPLLVVFGIIPYEHFYVKHESVNSSGEEGATYGNLQGSILYVWLMYFTWPLYTDWEGKNIFLFSYHFKTIVYIVVVFSFYVYLFKEVLLSNKSKITVLFSSLLLFLMVIVKGPQKPFGFIFTSLMQYFPPFRVFRSPDNKISYAIVLVLCCLPIFIHFKSRKHLLSFLLISFVFSMQFVYPFFNREVIRGNPDKSMDKLIELTPPFTEVIDILNSEKETSYILNLPSANFSKTEISPKEYHWGQDLIAKFTNHYFINYSPFSGISLNLNTLLESALFKKDYSTLNTLPIRFYLIRKNIPIDPLFAGSIDYVKNHYKKRMENSYFELYENLNGGKFISIENGILNLKKDSYFLVQPVDLNGKMNIILNTAHQGPWKAFRINHSETLSPFEIFYTIFITKNEITKKESLFNEWEIQVTNNKQIPYQIMVVYESFYIFIVLLCISMATVLLYCLIILFQKNKDNSESEGFSNL